MTISDLDKFIEEFGSKIKYQEFLKGIDHVLTEIIETTSENLLKCKKEQEKNRFCIKELNSHINNINKKKENNYA